MSNSGFHFCEHPLDVFGYYGPVDSRFATVQGSGETKKDSDTVVCSTLDIGAEISLHGMIDAAVKFVFKRAKWTKTKTVTKERAGASSTGDYGAASSTGDYGAASSTGVRGAASSTGKESCAIALGILGKAKAAVGCFLTLAEWKVISNEWHRVDVQSVKVDGEKIKADTWYSLVEGEFVVVL